MKQCHACKSYSPDAAAFCSTCGSSFAAKFCPHLHFNPLAAQYCRTCGSDQLSTPHPVSPPRLRVKLMLALLIASVLVLALAFFFTTLQRTRDLDRDILVRMTHTRLP